MQSKLICEEFSRKMWLYMDGSLPEDEMTYWEMHVRECPLCSTMLLESGEVLSFYENIPPDDIKEESFNVMINRAVNKKRSVFEALRSLGANFNFHADISLKKFAFGSVAFAAILTALFIIFKPGTAGLPGSKLYSPEAVPGAPTAGQNNTLEQASNIRPKSGLTRTKETAQANTTARKTGLMHAKYSWEDKNTTYTLRHVGSSLSKIKMKRVDYKTLDDWTLQAIALKRKMQWLEKDLGKSSM